MLKLLVPSVGIFFTHLRLEKAFLYLDGRRHISSRHFVPPSFNDVRSILNSAQLLSWVDDKGQSESQLRLITFDGDVTLYDDGASLTPADPVIPRILRLLAKDICVGIVTATGYIEAIRYYERLRGLLEVVHNSSSLTVAQKRNLVVLGGECNFLFQFDGGSCPPANKDDGDHGALLRPVPRDEWALEEMKAWTEEDITELLDLAERTLCHCLVNMNLSAFIVRKERAVGMVAQSSQSQSRRHAGHGLRLQREQLEETVLVVQRVLETSAVGRRIPFCAFNGNNISLSSHFTYYLSRALDEILLMFGTVRK